LACVDSVFELPLVFVVIEMAYEAHAGLRNHAFPLSIASSAELHHHFESPFLRDLAAILVIVAQEWRNHMARTAQVVLVHRQTDDH